MGMLSKRIHDSMTNFEKNIIPSIPNKNLLLEISNLCNHQCIFCANRKMTRKRGFMSLDFANRILKESYELGVKEVGFYATGEPLTNPDVAEYVKSAKSIGFSYTYLTTNGALLNKEKFINLVHSGLDSIKFSVNAGTEKTYTMIHGHNDFLKVVSMIRFTHEYRKVNNYNYKIYVSCILNQLNINEKEKLLQCVGNVADEVIFLNVSNQGGMMYEINNGLILEEEKNKIGRIPCPSLFNAITVTYEGYLSACCVDFQNYLVVADLNHVTLKEGWRSESFQKLRKMHVENRIQGTLCYNCIYNRNETVDPLVHQYATLMD